MAKGKQIEIENVKAAVQFGGWFHSQNSDQRLDDSFLLRVFRDSADAGSGTACVQPKPTEATKNSTGHESAGQ